MRKNFWPVLAIFIPIFLFGITPLWEKIFSDKKDLSYEIISDEKINKNLNFSWMDLKYEYKGEDLSKGRIVSLKISNTGDIPIKSNDFESDIKIYSNESNSILDYKITKLFPSNIDASHSLNRENSFVSIKPTLFNSGDEIYVDVLLNSLKSSIYVDARIVGVNKVGYSRFNENSDIFLIKVNESRGRVENLKLSKIPAWVIVFGSAIGVFVTGLFASAIGYIFGYLGFKSVWGIVLIFSMGFANSINFHNLISIAPYFNFVEYDSNINLFITSIAVIIIMLLSSVVSKYFINSRIENILLNINIKY